MAAAWFLVNPPFMLTQELEIILPALARLLAQGNGAVGRIDRLAGETLPPNA